MYPVDMHPDERDGDWEAVRALKAIEWELQQYETIVGSKHKTGELSCPSGALTMRKSQSTWHSDLSPPIAPSLYKSFGVRQKNIKDILKGGSIKEMMGRLIRKFFIYDSVAPNKANLTTSRIWLLVHNKLVISKFSNLILFHTLSRCSLLCHVLNISYIWFVGMGIEPPSPYEINNKYLEME